MNQTDDSPSLGRIERVAKIREITVDACPHDDPEESHKCTGRAEAFVEDVQARCGTWTIGMERTAWRMAFIANGRLSIRVFYDDPRLEKEYDNFECREFAVVERLGTPSMFKGTLRDELVEPTSNLLRASEVARCGIQSWNDDQVQALVETCFDRYVFD